MSSDQVLHARLLAAHDVENRIARADERFEFSLKIHTSSDFWARERHRFIFRIQTMQEPGHRLGQILHKNSPVRQNEKFTARILQVFFSFLFHGIKFNPSISAHSLRPLRSSVETVPRNSGCRARAMPARNRTANSLSRRQIFTPAIPPPAASSTRCVPASANAER